MRTLRRLLRRLSNFATLRRDDQRLKDEIEDHVAQQTAENLRAGLSPSEARRQALLKFGPVESIKEDYRAERGMVFIETFLQDLRFAFRMLRKSPGFTTVAVLTLALGIGANASVFSVFDLDLLRPLPYANANRLVFFGMLMPSFDSRPFLFTASYLQLRVSPTPFESIASWRPGVAGCDLTETQPLRLACVRAGSTFLPTFGINPILGRNLSAEDDGPSAPSECLISYTLWQSRFGGRPTAIGQTLSLDGRPTRIIGILPPNFEWPTLERVDVILPEGITAAERADPMAGVVRAYARLKPGVSMEEARAQLEPALESWRRASPPMFRKEIRLGLTSVREDQVRSISLALFVLFGASLTLLLLAVANVTNLLSARAAARKRELAVRTALGASRKKLIALQLTESTLLGLCGGLAGGGIAFVLLRLFAAVAPAGVPHITEARLDPPVLLFVLCASVIAGLACGVVPALAVAPVRTLLAGPSLAAPRARLGAMLVTGQVAASFVLIVGAGLFLETLHNIENVPLGMTTSHIVTAEITLGRAYDQPGSAAAFFNRLDSALRDLSGVTGVAISDSLPPTGGGRAHSFFDIRVKGRPPFPKGEGGLVGWCMITPGYFQILRIPIIEGRGFDSDDQGLHANSIVVSKLLAARLFAGEDPIGQHLQLELPSGPWYTVIGVVGDVKYLDQAGRVGRSDPAYYLPRPLSPEHTETETDRDAFFLVRSPMKPAAVERLVREVIGTLDPTLLANISSLDARVDRVRVQPRFNAALITLFAVTGLLLAAIGLYGVLSFLVSTRTREIGIRIALGAAPRTVLRMILWRGLYLVLAGLAAGAVLAFADAHLLQGLLYGITPGNPGVAAASALLMLLAGFAACYFPARRATRVDPMVALRYE